MCVVVHGLLRVRISSECSCARQRGYRLALVADRVCQLQALPVAACCGRRLAPAPVQLSQTVEGHGRAEPITQFTPQAQTLPVQLCSCFQLTAVSLHVADVVQRHGGARAISDPAAQHQALFEQPDSGLSSLQRSRDDSEVVQGVGDTEAVAESAPDAETRLVKVPGRRNVSLVQLQVSEAVQGPGFTPFLTAAAGQLQRLLESLARGPVLTELPQYVTAFSQQYLNQLDRFVKMLQLAAGLFQPVGSLRIVSLPFGQFSQGRSEEHTCQQIGRASWRE